MTNQESKQYFCDNCGKIKYEKDIHIASTGTVYCLDCGNDNLYEIEYINQKAISTAKDEALLIRNYCKSINVAVNRILKSNTEYQVNAELGYLTEKVEKLNKAYTYLIQSMN